MATSQRIAESTASGKNALRKTFNFRRHVTRFQAMSRDRSILFCGMRRFFIGESQPYTLIGRRYGHTRTYRIRCRHRHEGRDSFSWTQGGGDRRTGTGWRTDPFFIAKPMPVLAAIATGSLIPQPYPGEMVAQDTRSPFQDRLRRVRAFPHAEFRCYYQFAGLELRGSY